MNLVHARLWWNQLIAASEIIAIVDLNLWHHRLVSRLYGFIDAKVGFRR